MRLDLHVHTRHSPDSAIKPEDLLDRSIGLGIIPAITDHNSIGCHAQLRSLGLQFIPGEEVRTDRGDLIGLYINELIQKETPFGETLDRIHEQGGIAYLPHMYDRTRHGAMPEDDEIDKIDIIEIFNPRCLDPVFNTRAKLFAKKHGRLSAVGSDTHFLFEFGTTYNELPDFDLDNPKELLRQLAYAGFTTKKAPFYVRGTTSLVKLSRRLLG